MFNGYDELSCVWFRMSYFYLIEQKDCEVFWRDEIMIEVWKFFFLVIELLECKYYICCIVKFIIFFCDYYWREVWCYDDEDFLEVDIWIDQLVVYYNVWRL